VRRRYIALDTRRPLPSSPPMVDWTGDLRVSTDGLLIGNPVKLSRAGSRCGIAILWSIDMAEADQTNLTVLTVELLSAYVSNNSLTDGDLAGLIQSTHAALKVIEAPAPAEPPAPEHVPAVTIRKSLASPNHILSLIDGKPYQTLKRHLSRHGLTPAEYRERYGLAKGYPMVAPAYSEQRRVIAQRLGLGRKVKSESAAAAPAPAPVEAIAPSPVAAKPARVAPKKTATAVAREPAKDAAPATEKPVRAAAKRVTKASTIEAPTAPPVEPAVKKAPAKKGAAKSGPKAAKAAPAKRAKAAPQPDATPVPAVVETKTPKAQRARKVPAAADA
jgi:predicted transcriptional regulator